MGSQRDREIESERERERERAKFRVYMPYSLGSEYAMYTPQGYLTHKTGE